MFQIYNICHVNATMWSNFKIMRSPIQISTLISITMTEPPAEQCSGQHLSDINIAKILTLDKASIFQREIMSLVKCSWIHVQGVLATYTFKTFQRCNPWWDYQRKTTHENQYIEHALKQNDSISLCDITNIIREHGVPVFEATIQCQRLEMGLSSYIAAEKPRLYAENIAKRPAWIMKYKYLTMED